jgi:hypothetical protein
MRALTVMIDMGIGSDEIEMMIAIKISNHQLTYISSFLESRILSMILEDNSDTGTTMIF